MTGLDLELFLRLARVDPASWATLGAVAAVVGLLVWSSWGSRRALRKCLVLSVLAHLGVGYLNRDRLATPLTLAPKRPAEAAKERIRQIRVRPEVVETAASSPG